MCGELFWGNEEEKILLTVTFLKEIQEDTLDQICYQKKNISILKKLAFTTNNILSRRGA